MMEMEQGYGSNRNKNKVEVREEGERMFFFFKRQEGKSCRFVKVRNRYILNINSIILIDRKR